MFGKFVALVGMFILATLCTIFHGYVLSVLWQWFVVGKFTMASLSIAEAIGLSVLVSFLTKQYVKQETNKLEHTSFSITFSVLALLTGWIVHLFV